MARREGTPRSREVATALGGLAGGGLMGGVAYSHGTDVILGAGAGLVLVGALAHGVAAGTASPSTLWAVLFGLFFGMIGPGCDDYGGHAVIPAALVGAVFGRVAFGRRRRRESSMIPADATGGEPGSRVE